MTGTDLLPLSSPAISSRRTRSRLSSRNTNASTPDKPPVTHGPASGSHVRKRVEFSDRPIDIDQESSSTRDSEQATALKHIPPSKNRLLQDKPILKPTVSTESITQLHELVDVGHLSCGKMESLFTQLKGGDVFSSTEAYQSIFNSIKACTEPSEETAFKSKLGVLQKHIKRDLVVLDDTHEVTPEEQWWQLHNLISSALKVLIIMVWNPTYSSALSDDFRIWIVERSVRVLHDHVAPKATLLQYMRLLSSQNFKPATVNSNNRACRIVEVVSDITNHVSGKAIVLERLSVFRRLFDQSKPAMKVKAVCWIPNVLSAMGHGVKDIRTAALSVATKACSTFPASPSISEVVRGVLTEDSEGPEKKDHPLGRTLIHRLEKIVAAKDDALQVPQIWAVVLLLCHSSRTSIDVWEGLKHWLKVIQRCFNCNDTQTRSEAFTAWNRFVYIVRPHEAASNLVSMLAKPVRTQMYRVGDDFSNGLSRSTATSSYCTLLYYAFRPSATHKQCTRMWNEYIVKFMTSTFLSRSTTNNDLCCQILISLFWHSSPSTKLWNENRVHDHMHIEPSEIPTVDCKWIRSNSEAVLTILQLIVKHNNSDLGGVGPSRACIVQAWRHFLIAIRESSGKEIKQSADTKKALNSILRFITECPEVAEPGEPSLATVSCLGSSRARSMSFVAVEELGPLTVAEALGNEPTIRSLTLVDEIIESAVDGLRHCDTDGLIIFNLQRPSNDFLALVRCVNLIRTDLSHFHTMTLEELEPVHISPVALCVSLLRRLPVHIIRPCLDLLHHDLIHAVEDKNGFLRCTATSIVGCSLHKILCSSVSNVLSQITHAELNEFGDLEAALVMQRDQGTADSTAEVSFSNIQGTDPPSCSISYLKASKHLARVSVESDGGDGLDTNELAGTSFTAIMEGIRILDCNRLMVHGIQEQGARETARNSETCLAETHTTQPEYNDSHLDLTPSLDPIIESLMDEVLETESCRTRLSTPTAEARLDGTKDLELEVPSSPPLLDSQESPKQARLYYEGVVLGPGSRLNHLESLPAGAEDEFSPVRLRDLEESPPTTGEDAAASSDEAPSIQVIIPKLERAYESERLASPEMVCGPGSDEYDALAASQLSQSLECQSAGQFQAPSDAVRTPPESSTNLGRKRKRRSRETKKREKRQRTLASSEPALPRTLELVRNASDEMQWDSSRGPDQPADDIDCITVVRNPEPPSVGSACDLRLDYVGQTPVSTESLHKLQPSPRSVNSSSEQASTCMRDAETSPSLHMRQETGMTKSSRLISAEATEDADPSTVLADIATITNQTELEEPSTADSSKPEMPVSAAAIMGSQDGSRDIVAKLQTVLGNMNATQLEGVELSQIHSLCFQIGLKAQELSQKLATVNEGNK